MGTSSAANPTTPAIIHSDGELSYGELESQSRRLAATLSATGIGHGQLLAFFPSGQPNDLLLLDAAPRAGVALLPLDARLPAETLRHLVRSTGTEWVLTSGNFPTITGPRAIAPERLFGRMHSHPPAPATPLAPDAPRLLLATSGSSGAPKAVMLSENNLTASARAARTRIPLRQGDRWLCCLPLFHIGGLSIPFRCLDAGATALLHNSFEPERVLTHAHRYSITHLSLVPTQLHRLLEHHGDRPAPPTLRSVLIGGAPLPMESALRAHHAGWPIHPSYGLSECASQVATLERFGEDWRVGEVGRPLPGFTVNTTLEGRLFIRGAAVMLGYANPNRTPGDGVRDGGIISHDLGTLGATGELTVAGRADTTIISGGEKIDPGVVEAVLGEHPTVVEAAVVGSADAEWGERVTALVVGTSDEQALQAWCRDRLPGPWRPKRFHFVNQLPRTPLGKIKRKVCCEIARNLAKKGKTVRK